MPEAYELAADVEEGNRPGVRGTKVPSGIIICPGCGVRIALLRNAAAGTSDVTVGPDECDFLPYIRAIATMQC